MSKPNKDFTHPFNTLTAGRKAEQMYREDNVTVSGRPKTTDHNFSDDFIRSGPPHNHLDDDQMAQAVQDDHTPIQRKQEARGRKKERIIRDEEEVLGVNALDGREKKSDELAEIANEDSVHA